MQSIARVADANPIQPEADAEPQPQPHLQPQRAADGQHADLCKDEGGVEDLDDEDLDDEDMHDEDLHDEDLVALLGSVCTCDHRNVTCSSSSSSRKKSRRADGHGAYAALLNAAACKMQDELVICSTCRLVTRACVSPIVLYLGSKSKAAAAAASKEDTGSSDHVSVGDAALVGCGAKGEAVAAAAAAIRMWKMPPQCVGTTTTNPAVRNAGSQSTGQQAAHLHGVAWKDCRHFHNDGAMAVRHRLSGFHSFRTTGKLDALHVPWCVSTCDSFGFLL